MPLTTYGWSGTCMSRLEAPPLASSMCGSSSHLLLCGKALRIMNAASRVMHLWRTLCWCNNVAFDTRGSKPSFVSRISIAVTSPLLTQA